MKSDLRQKAPPKTGSLVPETIESLDQIYLAAIANFAVSGGNAPGYEAVVKTLLKLQKGDGSFDPFGPSGPIENDLEDGAPDSIRRTALCLLIIEAPYLYNYHKSP